jgi:nucleoside-diphosphate-sugar epimerase
MSTRIGITRPSPASGMVQSMTIVLVTGASGFIGRSTVAALLRRGAEVHAVARSSVISRGSEYWHTADLLDRHATTALVNRVAPDAVLHLAWFVEHNRYWTSTKNLEWVAASVFLARAAQQVGARRFVGTGTCYEYDFRDVIACNERSTPLRPTALYGIAKDATRRLIEGLAKQAGFSFAWARPFFLYGHGECERRLVPSVARALLAGEIARCGSGEALRDFIDVRDAGDALAAITLGTISGPVNVGTGTAVSIGTVASMLASLAGRPELVALGAIADRPNEPSRIAADITRLMSETDANPSRNLEDGLRSALEYWSTMKSDGERT